MLTVAVRLPGGGFGTRAVGVVANPSNPVTLVAGNLPFVESFVKYPSPYFTPKLGKNITVHYTNKTLSTSVPAGSNLFGMRCNGEVQGFNTADYFDTAKNADNIGYLTLCNLNLTGLGQADTILLHLSGALLNASPDDLSTVRMRVKSNGNLLTSLEGETEQRATGFDQDWYFPLEVGKIHHLTIEFVGKGLNDVLALTQIAVIRAANRPAFGLHLVSGPKDRPNLGVEKYTLLLENLSSQPLSDLLIKGSRNGKWVASHTVATLKGFERQLIEIPIDLSTTETVGERMEVAFECSIDPLNPALHQRTSATVTNFGRVVPMPTTTYVQSAYGLLPVDPKITYMVTERLLFTDNGGYWGNYTTAQESTIKFLPSDPSLKVRVRFTRFRTVDGKAQVRIYTRKVSALLSLDYVSERAILMGDTVTTPKTYISEADDGGVTIHFESLQAATEAGWVAEVDMVPAFPSLTLLSVEANGIGTESRGQVPVKVRIRNSLATPLDGVIVRVTSGKTLTFQQTITVPAGETDFTLSQLLDLPAATPTWIKVTVMGEDTDGSDNELWYPAVYDRYCSVGALPDKDLYIKELKIDSQFSYPLREDTSPAALYSLDKPIALYLGEGVLPLEVKAGGDVPEHFSVSVWVDWNDNGEFESSEQQISTIDEGYEEMAKLQLAPPTNTRPGMKRMRITLAPTAELTTPCPSSKFTDGNVVDCTLEVKAGNYPNKGDLELSTGRTV